jgi:hypothetical protein
MSEDFADGVEEVDLLVAARKLVGEFSGLSLGIENHAKESGQIGAKDSGARFGDPSDFEPETFGGENGLEPDSPVVAGDQARLPGNYRAPAGIAPGEGPQGTTIITPQTKPGPGKRAQRVSRSLQPRYWRRSVMQIEFP